MGQKTLKRAYLPELGEPYSGKVRDIYEDGDQLVMIASDRISCFDKVLNQQIPHKGAVLTSLSAYWFEQTADIIPNHMKTHPDPSVMITRKCKPIPIEIVVRGYLTGSMWRDYKSGKREKCGVRLPAGLEENDKLPHPILTPTTKAEEGHDEDISKQEILSRGIVNSDQWRQIEQASLALYARGNEKLNTKGLVLVDTKYEFGFDEKGELTLIDEVHTPDSSRFWFQADLACNEVRFPDKEFVRQWLIKQGFMGDGPLPDLDPEVVKTASEGYLSIYEQLMGRPLERDPRSPKERIVEELQKAKIIQGAFVLILTETAPSEALITRLDELRIPSQTLTCSARDKPEELLKLCKQYNESLEPLVCITMADTSDALSGLVAAHQKWPVIALTQEKHALSSLHQPTDSGVVTVIDPNHAALAASRILDLTKNGSQS